MTDNPSNLGNYVTADTLAPPRETAIFRASGSSFDDSFDDSVGAPHFACGGHGSLSFMQELAMSAASCPRAVEKHEQSLSKSKSESCRKCRLMPCSTIGRASSIPSWPTG